MGQTGYINFVHFMEPAAAVCESVLVRQHNAAGKNAKFTDK